VFHIPCIPLMGLRSGSSCLICL